MNRPSFFVALVLLAAAGPLHAQQRDIQQRSPSMLLFSVDAVAPGGSYEMLMLLRDRGGSAFGAGASFGLLPRVRIATQLAARRTQGERPGIGERADNGWYAGASLLGLWTLAGDEHTGLDLAAGVQVDHNTLEDATRSSAPVGMTARLARRIGGVNMQPFVGGGIAMRRDNVHALREWSSPAAVDGSSNIGWYAHVGARVGTGRFWVQPAMTWSRVLGDDAFPSTIVQDGSGNFASVSTVISTAPLFSIKAGFTP